MMRFILITGLLAFAAPAMAEEPHGEPTHDAGHADDHGDKVHGDDGHGKAHGDDGHGDDGHGEAHGDGHGEGGDHAEGGHHGPDYVGDLDGDGLPNWLDWDGDGDGTLSIFDDGADYENSMIFRLILHGINLFLLFALLFWALRRPVADALANRAHDVRKGLTDAAQARDESKQRFDDLAARISNFEAELAQMKAEAAADAQQEEAKLIERANREAERIRTSADRTIRDEVQRARVALRNDAVELAVQLAEQTLRSKVGGDDQKKLAREFLESLNG